MRKRPFILTLFALVFVMVALSIPIQIMALYNHGPQDWPMVLQKITLTNWAVITICLINAVLSAQAHKALFFTLPLSVLLVIVNNFLVYRFGTDYSGMQAAISGLFFSVFCLGVFQKDSMKALRNPHLQWWKPAKRRQLSLPVWLEIDGKPQLARTVDISSTGAFLSTIGEDQADTNIQLSANEAGSSLKIYLGLEERELAMEAEIVRFGGGGKSQLPSGIGVRFKDMSLAHRIQLWKLVHVDYRSMPL